MIYVIRNAFGKKKEGSQLPGCTQEGGGGGEGAFRCVQSATWGDGGLEIGKNAYVINGRPLCTIHLQYFWLDIQE